MNPWDPFPPSISAHASYLERLSQSSALSSAVQQAAVRQLQEIENQRRIDAAIRPSYATLPSTTTSFALAQAAELSRRLFERNLVAEAQDELRRKVEFQERLVATSLATSSLAQLVELARRESTAARSVSTIYPGYSSLLSDLSAVYHGLARSPFAGPQASLLTEWPALETYSAASSMAVLTGLPDEDISVLEDEDSEDALNTVSVELVTRLQAVDPRLVQLYQGAIGALAAGGPDWVRHFSTSARELGEHLLRLLAPNDQLDLYFSEPADHQTNGEYTRHARLDYLFRNVAVGEYRRMAEKDIDLTEAMFFPANTGVHSLSTPLTDIQVKVFRRRIEGSLSVVLATAGH